MSSASTIHPAAVSLPAEFTSVALIPLDEIAWLRVTGGDRVRWLNGMASNSIQSLTPGMGSYNFFLNAQGRIQGDASAFLREDAILLETQLSEAPRLRVLLEQFIIMDDVELHDAFVGQTGLLVVGPQAPALLAQAGIDTSALRALTLTSISGPAPFTLIHAHSPLVPRFELWGDPACIATLTSSFAAHGVNLSSPAVLEQLRILEGTPRFGTDIRNSETAKDLPQETSPVGIPSRALHFSKGCYLGQEIVERIRSRGNLHRAFSGFILTGDLPGAGTPLFDASTPDKPVGELTSITRIELPSGPAQLALGYIRREALDRGNRILYSGGSAFPVSIPFDLPRIQP